MASSLHSTRDTVPLGREMTVVLVPSSPADPASLPHAAAREATVSATRAVSEARRTCAPTWRVLRRGRGDTCADATQFGAPVDSAIRVHGPVPGERGPSTHRPRARCSTPCTPFVSASWAPRQSPRTPWSNPRLPPRTRRSSPWPPVTARGPRPSPPATGSHGCTRPTRTSSPTRRSTRCTTRCPTACTATGPWPLSRRASTSSARSPSRPTPPRRAPWPRWPAVPTGCSWRRSTGATTRSPPA